MTILESIITAVGLCADCFSVSLCSSVTLKQRPGAAQLSKISLSFAVIQSGLLVLGWMCGSLLAGIAGRIAHIIGGLLLIYVGASMLIEAIRNSEQARDLNGWRNIIIGGIATSIDALAVGGARSLEGGDSLAFAFRLGICRNPHLRNSRHTVWECPGTQFRSLLGDCRRDDSAGDGSGDDGTLSHH